MPRLLTPVRLRALLVVVLATSFLALVAPANADDPASRATRVFLDSYNLLDDDTQIGLVATVYPVPMSYGTHITGTVDYRDSNGNVLATGVSVNAETGISQVMVAKPTVETTYYADFHATGVWQDSTSNAEVYKYLRLRTVLVTPEPTLVKVTAGSPKLTLTLAATAKFLDGTPARGVITDFSGECLIQSGKMCGLLLQYCSAVTDSNGFASCRGAGTLGALVSILGGSVWMSAYSSVPGYHPRTTTDEIPVIVRS